MSNFAQTIVVGNLGKDPVLYNNDPNKPAVVFGSLGVSGKYPQRDTNGNIMKDQAQKTVYVRYTTWYDFEIRGNRAIRFAEYHRKGMQTQLIGEMREREYDTKLRATACYNADGTPLLDGNGQHYHAYTTDKRKAMYLKVDNWVFQEGKPANSAYNAPAAAAPQVQGVVPQVQAAVPQMPQMPQAPVVGQPQVQAAFTGQPTMAAPQMPQTQAVAQPQTFVVDSSSQLPAGV